MSGTNTNESIDRIKFARQELDKERAHRREKLWKIFSWAATLLVAITGGVIALKTGPPENFKFSWWLRGVLFISALSLMGFACLWINQNLRILRGAEEAIAHYDKKLEIVNVIPDVTPKFGYNGALVLLSIAAIVAIAINV